MHRLSSVVNQLSVCLRLLWTFANTHKRSSEGCSGQTNTDARLRDTCAQKGVIPDYIHKRFIWFDLPTTVQVVSLSDSQLHQYFFQKAILLAPLSILNIS